MASNVILKANAAPRGGGSQTAATYGNVQSFELTWSWGARPASAIVTYVGDEGIEQNAAVQIIAPATNDPVTGAPLVPGARSAVFYGIAKKEVATDSSAGRTNVLEFVDMRELLSWDVVFGFFNQRQDLLVNGIWTKRYAHLLPANQSINLITYTDAPYAAQQILDFVFDAPTVHSPWTRLYQEVQVTDAVYNIDCSTGRTLADVVTEISERQGLVFTLLGGMYQLVWALKGVGYLPLTYDQFPANSDHRRLGEALSGKPDSVTIFGNRNRYQVLNIPMAPDWNANVLNVLSYPPYSPSFTAASGQSTSDCQHFENQFISYVFSQLKDPITGATYHTPGIADPDNLSGYQLAAARANTITVGELADIFDGMTGGLGGEAYRDRRKFNGRTRLDLPVVVYVRLLVFRAYRLPVDFNLVNAAGNNMGPLSCKIVPTTLVEATYDFATGAMSYIPETAPGGNGLVIVKGCEIMSPPPITFQTDQFNLAAWQNTQNLWQRVNFQIDDTGDQTQFIIFDEPRFVSNNLMSTIDGHGVLNKDATFSAAPVLAALTFEAERFLYYQGVEGVNAVQNVADLSADFVSDYGNTVLPIEQTFADGETATEKAEAIADYVLEQQPVYVYGGYLNRGNNATQLSGTFDRVNLKLDASGGLLESVDFTSERASNTFEPERDFERRIQLIQLAPGQLELRDTARAQTAFAAALRSSPKYNQNLLTAYYYRYGNGETLTHVAIADADSDRGPLAAGTPLWKAPSLNNGTNMTQTKASLPEDVDPSTDTVFAGVTIRDNEDPSSYFFVGLQRLPLQRDGWGLVRVMGPASVGDTLVQATQVGIEIPDYLVSQSQGGANVTAGAPVAGTLQQAVAADGQAHLVMVRFGQGGGASGGGSIQLSIFGRFDNYFIGTRHDGSKVNVAMPWKFRRSTYDGKSVTLPDGSHTYTYVASGKRTDNTSDPAGNPLTTVEIIYDPYADGDVIYAIQPTEGTGVSAPPPGTTDPAVPVVWLDVNADGRRWLAQIQSCYNGQPSYNLLPDAPYQNPIS